MAVANYQDAKGHYPPAYVLGPDGRPWHSWRVLILPYIEQNDIYKAYDFNEPWDGPNNRKLADKMPRIFAFHGDHKPGNTITNYVAVVGPETMWPGNKSRLHSEIQDGLGATLLIVENQGSGIHWMEPRDLDFRTMDFTLDRPNGISSKYQDPAVVTVDGTVFRLDKDCEKPTIKGLLTVNKGEPLDPGDSRYLEKLPDGRLRFLK